MIGRLGLMALLRLGCNEKSEKCGTNEGED